MDAYRLTPDPERIDPAECLDHLAALARRQSVVFFFGAGISRSYPSLNPLVATSQGLPGLHPLLVDMIVAGCPPEHRDVVAKSLADDPLEAILEHLSRVIGDTAFDFLDALEPPPQGLCEGPNYNHYSLALIAKAGLCSNFITVNFDTLLEQAFAALGAGEVVVPEEHPNERSLYERAASADRNAAHLFKLHGTMRDKRRLLTTIETIGLGLPAHKRDTIRRLLTANACFFMGYRANDLDIFPLLETLPPTAEVFWFDIDLRPDDVGPMAKYLASRPHRIIINSDLSSVLQALLHRLGIDDTEALEHIGVESLSEIPAKEVLAKERRTDQLLAFAATFRERYLPDAAARLTMADALRLGDGRAAIRAQLFASVAEGPIPEQLEFAYRARLAEHQWGAGQFHDALTTRRSALQALGNTLLPLRGRFRCRIEQYLYMSAHALSLSRNTPRLLRKALWGAAAAWYTLLPSIMLLTSWRVLTDLDRGRLWIRVLERPARLLHIAVDRQLLAQVRVWLGGHRKKAPGGLSFSGRAYAAVAIWLYRACLRFSSPAFGWKSLVMRNLAMLLMHRSGRCTIEAKQLIDESRGPLARRDSSKEYSRTGIHEAFRLMYEGTFKEAEEVLEETYRYYRDDSKYRVGQALTRYAQALCFAAQGKRDEAARAVELHDALRGRPDA